MKRDDIIVGVVVGEKYAGYDVDINMAATAFIPKSALRYPLKRGDTVSARVDSINEVNEVNIGDIRTFLGGEIIMVSPVKVPRMIGKTGSMMTVLKQGTGSQLVIGRNGMIWAKEGNIELLTKALRKIEDEAHLSDLTNKIKNFLEEKKGESK